MTNKWFYPIIVTAAISIAVGLGGWNLLETASVPKTYSTKVETDKKLEILKVDHEKRHESFEQTMQNGFDRMFQVQRDMQHSINELNRKVD